MEEPIEDELQVSLSQTSATATASTPSSLRQQTRLNENLLSLGKLRNSIRINSATSTQHVEVQPADGRNTPTEILPPPPSYDTVVKLVNDEIVSLPSTSQLPRYQDVGGLKDAPPTYRSLFSDKMLRSFTLFGGEDSIDVVDGSDSANGRCKFGTLMTNILLFIFLIIFVLLLPISMMSVGIIFIHSCPVQPRIPIYLIVLGFFQMLECCGRLGYKIFQNGQQNSWRERYRRKDPLVYFVIVWFVIGSMWVYNTDPACKDCFGFGTDHSQTFVNSTGLIANSTSSTYSTPITSTLKPTSKKGNMYCNKTIYNFAFWIITIYYSVIGFFCLMLLIDVTFRTLTRCFCPQR